MSSNIIESLRDDSKYYGDFGKKYLSNSDIYSLLNNPKNFRISQKGLPLLKGGYFHTAMLEPQKIGDYPVIDASTRSTKAFKEHILENNLYPYDVLLSKEVDEITTWVNAMKSNFVMYSDIYAQGNIYEQPAIATIFGIEWKGKADIITADKVIDIKTTGNIDKFKWSANDYNYDSQAYIYEQLFGKPLVFLVVDKVTKQLGMFVPTEEFLARGEEKVVKAIEVYNKFCSEEKTQDLGSYYIREEL